MGGFGGQWMEGPWPRGLSKGHLGFGQTRVDRFI